MGAPADATRLLLAGDETAVPAIAVIAESLTGDVPATVLLEVPHPEDALHLRTHPNVKVVWLPREGAAHGERLIPAVRETTAALARAAAAPPAAEAGGDLSDVDVDIDLLWEVPAPAAAAAYDGLYAWLAGEAGVVKTLRRHLVQELGIDRRAVAFMGYRRLGRAEANYLLGLRRGQRPPRPAPRRTDLLGLRRGEATSSACAEADRPAVASGPGGRGQLAGAARDEPGRSFHGARPAAVAVEAG